ncbi:HAD-superfamily hydrolase subfamily IA [Elysia marginata]|uniref:HAD-superfamily hydrolase subfamily IA n=1 Tax=Elysia marginata TaxID=1093978 RepID=A0AAV4FVM4_9GAST|nr:HAD-superfamily hydrolase subfamily IA [Elysia marginata]
MDGTLTVSVHNFDWMREELQLDKGEPILETLHKMPIEQAAPLWKKVDEMEFYFATRAKPMPHIKTLLNKLSGKGVKLGIITRNTFPVVLQTLETCQLSQFFTEQAIVDRAACAPKPLPDGVNWLMNTWQADANDTVMVGDYLYDLQAGRAANVATIHIDTEGNFNWPEYTDWAISNFDEIINFV